MSYEAVKQGLTDAYMDVYGHAPTEAQIQEQMQWHADNDDPSSVKNQVMHGFANAGVVDNYEDPHYGEEGMLGGYGATIGAVAGGIIGGIFGGPAGAAAGGAIGGALLGGGEEYETSHDWTDTGQSALYGGASGAVMGAGIGTGNIFIAGAAGYGATTLSEKAQGGSWSDASNKGIIAGLASAGGAYGVSSVHAAGYGSATWGGTASQSAGATQMSSSVASQPASGLGATSMESSMNYGTGTATMSSATTGANVGTMASQTAPITQASALTTGEAASTGLFGTGYSAMELLAGTSIALQGVGTVMNYINQEDELSPEEEADRQIRYWNALAKAGYGSSVPGSDSTTPTTPGSVYKSGSITK